MGRLPLFHRDSGYAAAHRNLHDTCTQPLMRVLGQCMMPSFYQFVVLLTGVAGPERC
ncbi:MAG TPA: hypothetical protein VG013_33465 [Gemmataceae bacterium]|nr:hypothetical protein [Gemmataceae bacterium]